MQIIIRITTDNAAFHGEDDSNFELVWEVSRILQKWSEKIQAEEEIYNFPLRDVNGNKVGAVEVIDD